MESRIARAIWVANQINLVVDFPFNLICVPSAMAMSSANRQGSRCVSSTSKLFSMDSFRRWISSRLSVSPHTGWEWMRKKKIARNFNIFFLLPSADVSLSSNRDASCYAIRLAYFIIRHSCLIQMIFIHLFLIRFRFVQTGDYYFY